MGLVEAGRAIAARKLSSVELTTAMLERIAALDPKLHAYATVTADLALRQAKAADAEIAAGRARGPLHGVPIAVKDLCYSKGIPTGAGMAIHRDFRPDHDATVVIKLAEAGAVSLGKLQLTEGAFGAHHPEITRPVNPWRADAWTGVSSSGSGVATAAGLCFGSLGSDTGGSIRFPSTANGITGLKPTWGRVSRYAVFELAGSMDHVGPMTRSAIDAAAMLGVIAGADANDPTASPEPVPDYLAGIDGGVRGLRIGIDRTLMSVADADVLGVTEEAARVLGGLGARIVPVSVPSVDWIVAEWATLCAVEAAVAHEATFPSRADRYGPVLRGLLERGRSVDGLTISKIWTARQNFTGALTHLMRDIDLLLVPAMNRAAQTWAAMEASGREPKEIAARLRFTAPFDMSGSPTITLPGGFTASGMPIGFQLVGRHFDEALVLRAGHAYQGATDWHARRPPV
ncbi:MAG: amidase [Alphaproteobacteria bacterium]|nr:amidase [Alphaproteobacteria bacterium]